MPTNPENEQLKNRLLALRWFSNALSRAEKYGIIDNFEEITDEHWLKEMAPGATYLVVYYGYYIPISVNASPRLANLRRRKVGHPVLAVRRQKGGEYRKINSLVVELSTKLEDFFSQHEILTQMGGDRFDDRGNLLNPGSSLSLDPGMFTLETPISPETITYLADRDYS